MKNKFYTLLFCGLLLISFSSFGQKTVKVVLPDAGIDIGALNDAITSTADPGNTIFELKRGGVYYLNGAISHSGYTLHIRAEEGTGHRPILQPAVDELGASANHFNPGGPLILEGLHIQGRDELGAIANRQIIVSGVANRVTIDDCYFDYSNQAFIRLTSTDADVFISNSILRNAIRPENPNNGRIVDTRSAKQDSLVMVNSTIYNCGASMFSVGAGLISYYKWDHNTFFQCGFTYNISLAATIKADITNNIFYNYGYRANNYSHQPFFTVDSLYTVDEVDRDAPRSFNLSNNNWYIDPVYGDIINEFGKQDLVRYEAWDTEQLNPIPWKWVLRKDVFADQSIIDTSTVTPPPNMIRFIDNGQVNTSNIFREKLVFTNSPPLILDYWKFFVENNFEIGALNPPSPFADENPLILGEVETGAYNFSYNDNSKSATAATGGKPLGASKWVPYTTVSAKSPDVSDSSPIRIYPNPFTDNVTFEINAKASAPVRIIIYDLIGKEVQSVNTNLNPGANTIPVNFDSALRAGIYLYQVQTDANGTLKNISSGRLIKR